jgi:hypothetical protein
MKAVYKHLSIFITVMASVVLVATGLTSAATSSGDGTRVSPVRSDLVIQPGASKTVTVYVQNVTNGTEHLKVIVNDFVASGDESGAPALLLNGESNDQHGLKKYISTISELTIPKGKQEAVPVKVSIPKGTPGGGYYGAVRFAPANGSSGNANVALNGSVGSLVLVRVPGDEVEKMSLAGFYVRQDDSPHTLFTSTKNMAITVRIRNDGDVQEQPFGKILLKKGNKTIHTYEFNAATPPGNVLPDSIRKFSIPVKDIGSFGKYKVEGNFGYGSSGQLLSGVTTFYVVPGFVLILLALLVLLILFLIFVFPKMVRNYNRNVVRKASRRR